MLRCFILDKIIPRLMEPIEKVSFQTKLHSMKGEILCLRLDANRLFKISFKGFSEHSGLVVNIWISVCAGDAFRGLPVEKDSLSPKKNVFMALLWEENAKYFSIRLIRFISFTLQH